MLACLCALCLRPVAMFSAAKEVINNNRELYESGKKVIQDCVKAKTGKLL